MLLAACRRGEPAPAPGSQALADGPCSQQLFEGSRFSVCPAGDLRIETRWADRQGRPFRGFVALEQALGAQAERVAFAMNAGMFGHANEPIGLYVEDHRTLAELNRRKGGGNFHVMPNGVFLVRDDGKAAVVTSAEFQPSPNIRFATQSGPMLVVAGAINPRFSADSPSRYVRNGVGIGPDGRPVFVMSDDEVSMGKFARFFQQALHCRDALYLDGSVSSLWVPEHGRRDAFAAIGPMIVALRP
ncbi:phosphodiester glycosidase family protein [Sphingomonas ginkgonis]|uniref:phosphodiester glycosidase family protein n=1 Tax=Sphingomonas ginkgonis TaxID=2315330 RepID=UPI00163A2DB2|nr:phosphodiester glycosidase family protein [Sphingomonas ginkgonis]